MIQIFRWEVSAFGDESLTSPRVAPGAYGKTYSWVKHGYTPCTATCLGGKSTHSHMYIVIIWR